MRRRAARVVRDAEAVSRNRALIEARRLVVGARVRHVVGAPRVYVVLGYTEGAKVRVALETDPSLRGAFAPEFLERIDRGEAPTS